MTASVAAAAQRAICLEKDRVQGTGVERAEYRSILTIHVLSKDPAAADLII